MTPDPPTVVAVVTAYDPGPQLAALVQQVRPQVTAVVVVDDGSTIGLDVLDSLADAQVVHQANAGVAAALNAGVGIAQDLGADAVLTLDQDSGVPPGYVAAAVQMWRTAIDRGLPLAFVAPASYSGRPALTRGSVRGLRRAFDPMQSGSLVPVETYRRVGAYDEGLVIDAVDSEFTVRCLAAGLVPVIAEGCHLEHGMGERREGYAHHSADRVYFMARNGTLVTRRYARRQPGWVGRRLVEEAKAHLLRLTRDPERVALARAAGAGVLDGLRGRTGRRP